MRRDSVYGRVSIVELGVRSVVLYASTDVVSLVCFLVKNGMVLRSLMLDLVVYQIACVVLVRVSVSA